MLSFRETSEVLPTHGLVPAGPLPTAQDPDGVYPYESFCETSRRPVLQRYRFLILENDFLQVTICPDLGGRVYSLRLKKSDKETLHVSRTIRPVRILPRHGFIGGGIEVSFPISHTPSLNERVLFESRQIGNRIYIWCGEREVRFGMHWTVEYSMGEGEAFLCQRTAFFNPGPEAHPWMSWSNAGVPARPDTEFHFPGGPVLRHGQAIAVIDWKKEGPRCQSDMKRMTGFFWKEPDCGAFGVFTPSLGCGLYHMADLAFVPGIKLWTDGVGVDEKWVSQYTLDGEQCLEIQAGPLPDQSVKSHLPAGGRHQHVEFWIPSDKPLDIHAMVMPRPELVDGDQIPQFSWARTGEVSLWENVVAAWRKREPSALPQPPPLEKNQWAPSGLPDLELALAWAASATEGSTRDAWLFQLGAWLAGRDQVDAALEALQRSNDDRAHALCGSLFRRCKKQQEEAVNSFNRITCAALALHPQIVVERDLALALLGPERQEERAKWLAAVSALSDEWLVERRASLAADQGRWEEARDLLQSAHFQLVHQRYARTRLWQRICKHLPGEGEDQPAWLGEDDLAEFGAYREYEETDGSVKAD